MPTDRTLFDANPLWVDSALRAVVQRRWEAPVLRGLDRTAGGGRALEIGCGRRGTGLRLALQDFGVDRVDGIDCYPASVDGSLRATADLADRVRVEVGDACSLAAPDGSYDAVFSYHLLHHLPSWRVAVGEVARVLRPGGRFLSCEMTDRFVDHPLLRAVSRHPDDGDRPSPQTLGAALTAAGLQLVGQRTRLLGSWTALVAVRP